MPPQNRLRTEGPLEKLLLVEGPEDFHTICQLLDAHNIHDGVTIEGLRGYDEIKSDLRVRMKAGDQTHLGIIVDADTDFAKRWRSIRDTAIALGYENVPELPNPNGTIVQRADNPSKFGFWIMPDNQSNGMLEDFARMLLPDNDNLWSRAKEAVDAIPSEDRPFSDVHLAKAYVRTWLAWQRDPGMPIGRAIQKGKLDAQADVGLRLIDWHRNLFDLDVAGIQR